MSVIRAQPTPRGAGHVIRAVVAAWLLVLAVVVPVGAVEGPTKLFEPTVPASATPTTTITLAVEYRNREGSAPAYVRVVIDGTAHAMTSDGGDDWKKGVGHHFATKLPAGTHEVSFEAADTRKFSDEVDGGTITVAVPAPPTPAPTPDPTPAPKPTPTPDPPAPTPTPAGTPAPGSQGTGSGGTGGTGATGGTDSGGTGTDGGSNPATGAGGGTTGTTTDGTTTGTGRDGASGSTQTWGDGLNGLGGDSTVGATDTSDPNRGQTASVGGGTFGGTDGTGTGPGPDGSGTGSGSGSSPSGGSGAGGTGAGGDGSSGGWGALASALETLGVDTGITTLQALPTLVGTTGAVAMAMAFAIFGKKRRDEEQPEPDEVLQAAAARAGVVTASAGLVATVPGPMDLEAAMPRWRRPSLQQARKADPTRYVSTSPSLRFDESDASTIGYERRLIRYRVVGLLDAPDELRSVEIGQLDQGDEVQLLEKSGAYWLVRVPDGRQGWVHKMTLGEVVGDSATTEAEAWNVGDIDGDVLSAYLAARARA